MAQYCIKGNRIINVCIPKEYDLDKIQIGIPVMDDEAESKCKLCNNCYWKKTSTCFINRPATWDVER